MSEEKGLQAMAGHKKMDDDSPERVTQIATVSCGEKYNLFVLSDKGKIMKYDGIWQEIELPLPFDPQLDN